MNDSALKDLRMKDPKSLTDMIVGGVGVCISIVSSAVETAGTWLPWLLGVTLTSIAIYNQIQQMKLNSEKIERMRKRKELNNKNKQNDN